MLAWFNNIRISFLVLAALCGSAQAQGTLPVSLNQQFSFVGCSTAANACGTPLIGGLLYTYQVGTVATPQNTFQDTGLTLLNPWPLVLDANGRVPAFYLANGSVHIRLTDANGVVQFDYPSALVVGPSGGSGGSGAVDPTTIASTGDMKWRPTGETLAGWVKANGQTIGNALSGATGRANADTQSLFIYLWSNCHLCTVGGGKGATGLADFNANKTITVPDCRARICGMGLDDMGNTPLGMLQTQNITSAGDTPTTPGAQAGEDNHTLLLAQTPSFGYTPTGSISGSVTLNGLAVDTTGRGQATAGGIGFANSDGAAPSASFSGSFSGNGVTLGGSNQSHNIVTGTLLGSWYIKL